MMNKDERQTQILQLIEQAGEQQLLGTRELAERFGVSEMTVRRDLQQLSRAGLLRRQHGGAAPAAVHPSEYRQRKEVGIILASRTGKYSDPFFNALLEGVEPKLHALGYRIAYINTRVEINTVEQVKQLLQSTTVSGIILVGPPQGMESIDYLQANIRALVSTVDAINGDYDTVTFDGYRGMRKMVDHLVSLGRRRLGFISGGADFRLDGFKDAVAAHGLPTAPELTVIVPFGIDGWTRELGHIGAAQLMQLPEPPDALVCASDLLAIGAIQWLHQQGLRVPDDIAVTGCDNIDAAAFTIPSLTTIHVHKQYMGALVAERVVRRIENPDELPLFIQTPTQLIIRESCGSPSIR